MAIELCSSDESSIMSPARISFDISQTDYVPVEQHIRSTSSSSSIDFDFCVFRESFDLESSSADELFFDGKILPIEIKRRISSAPFKKIDQRPMSPPPPLPPCKNNSNPNTSNILDNGKISSNSKNEDKAGFLESIDEKQSSKSFWRFKRSSSLNCGNGYARTLCPLPLLSRSNSTGSTPSVKRNSSSSKDNLSHKQQSQRHFPKSVSSNNGHNCQKPPLKKVSHNNNGVKFSPVLNVPSASLFGLSSFFSSGKEKNKKK
ncbi:PREDICTED: uncharacterized protein LOC109239585 [Nicotiana attenuata]|uniref:Uncharacterized protein n=1 Tax=Nicotiana attenuata TaxID=49451 RepID=A0A314LB71_NICAT|nr:PREDICTED: uncharacterized protein LOC109239585 [Nicotiana attenuata]OIT38309.1 hypothetical protein A4A49_07131 [Nicotiana attenuata]